MHIYEVTETQPKEYDYKIKVPSLGNLLGNFPAAKTRKIYTTVTWKNPATDPCDCEEEDFT